MATTGLNAAVPVVPATPAALTTEAENHGLRAIQIFCDTGPVEINLPGVCDWGRLLTGESLQLIFRRGGSQAVSARTPEGSSAGAVRWIGIA